MPGNYHPALGAHEAQDGDSHVFRADRRLAVSSIYVGGEITEAWELLEPTMRAALVEGTIPGNADSTQVFPDSSLAEYRLLGAVALVTAPGYAALAVG